MPSECLFLELCGVSFIFFLSSSQSAYCVWILLFLNPSGEFISLRVVSDPELSIRSKWFVKFIICLGVWQSSSAADSIERLGMWGSAANATWVA